MNYTIYRHSRGVALLAALFVLFVLSILGIGLLMNVDDEIKLSKSMENSERALKVAEAGIQVARATFFDPTVKQVLQTEEISSVDGFYRGGYFLAQLESGFRGEEKWTQWRYDNSVSAYNDVSEIVTPVFRVWATGNNGINGSWQYEYSTNQWMLFARNLFPVVARGTYFSIEQTSGDTLVRAHEEYTGKQVVKDEGETTTYWKDDKSVLGGYNPSTAETTTAVSATFMSAMASFSDYSSVPGATEPVLARQRLYFTYAGNDSENIDATESDITSTVRLLAANALNNNTADGDPLSRIWEFDTGLHGVGTAPAFFDPDPDTTGDEIIYFAVLSAGTGSGALDLNETSPNTDAFVNFPNNVTHDSQQIYIYAIVDQGSTYHEKWQTPYPDPDLANSTDYPVNHVTGTNGLDPPYVRVPADMEPFMPENDLLPDYRDSADLDGQQNLVRGNLGWNTPPPALSPPIISVLYTDKTTGNLTPDRANATAASQDDPRIDIYLTYAIWSRLSTLFASNDRGFWAMKLKWDGSTDGWGPAGLRKPNAIQTRLMSLRDRLVRNSTDDGWDLTDSASRFPVFKWTYRVPAYDPDSTDVRPWNGYGEYVWDTWFEQDIAPLIRLADSDQSSRSWSTISGAGTADAYPVIYVIYESTGFPCTGDDNNVETWTQGPTTAQGSPVDFSGQAWSDSRLMVMAIRDTWEDYMVGNQTNPYYTEMNTANPTYSNANSSNPVEPYWVHDHTLGLGVCDTSGCSDSTDCACAPLPTYYPAFPDRTTINYSTALSAPYAGNKSKLGFPRPYTWSESIWNAKVRDAAADDEWSMFQQGWAGAGFDSGNPHNSKNLDVRGDNSAMCSDCLEGDGLLVASFQHNLTQETSGTFKNIDDRIDLRLHGINATSGDHIWDFHAPSTLFGDYNNASPAIANDKVFFAYKQFGERTVILEAVSASDGQRKQEPLPLDEDADAVILSPAIANGAVYVGTYSFSGTVPDDSNAADTPSDYVGDDLIRLFAMSPVLRLVSTGIYPFEYANYTGNSFRNITMLDHDEIMIDSIGTYLDQIGKVPVSKRKLQVWITGGDSKWEEVRDILQK